VFSPLEVEIKPSRMLWWLQLLSHLGVVVLLVQSVLPAFVIACLIAVTGISLATSYRQRSAGVKALRWDADLQSVALLEPGQGWTAAESLESILAWRWLLVLRIQAGGRHRRLVLLPDSVSNAAFRRLSVIARLAPMKLNAPDQATHN
jgi:hypothetical protein